MDLLADALAISGVRGTLGARIAAGKDWGWWAAPSPGAAFHAVTSGTVWLALPGRPAHQLVPGDLVLLPNGAEHVLASDHEALARTNEQLSNEWERADTGEVKIGSGPVRTRVLCAHYEYDSAVSTQVLQQLPEFLHIRAQDGGGGLDDTIRLLARELAQPGVATGVILNSLVDVLLVQTLRAWLASEPGLPPQSWLGALEDPIVGAALSKLHDDPARAWTNATLAREVSVSGATLSRRFPLVIGETPAAYLTRWRMDLAALRLRDTNDPLDTIARSVGYTSVYAFSRAFSRVRSEPPGRFRTMSRASAAA